MLWLCWPNLSCIELYIVQCTFHNLQSNSVSLEIYLPLEFSNWTPSQKKVTVRLFAAAASLKLTFWTKRGGSCKPCHFPRHWLHGSFWLSQVVRRFPLMHYLITYQVLPGDPGKDKFSPGKFLFILHAEHFWVCTTFIHETLVSQVEHLYP